MTQSNMSIVFRYLIKEIVKYVSLILMVAVGIYIAVDFFEKIDNFLNAGLTISRSLTYFFLNIPFITSQLLPVCILISVLIVFGLMARHNEILALRSSGVSMRRLVRPVIAVGLAATVLHFLFSEVVVPYTAHKANAIWLTEVKKESAVVSRENNIWLRENRMIMHIKHFNPLEKAIYGITIYYFDDYFRLIRRIDAAKGVFEENQWVLSDLMEQHPERESDSFTAVFRERIIEPIGLLPENLSQVVKKASEMNFQELADYVRKIQESGYDATVYRVDLHAKVAFPFICAVMSLLGPGIAARAGLKEGLPISIAYGLGIAFFYWIFYSFCISLGYGNMLPPIIAAWSANFVFGGISGMLLLSADA
jgi:lipopolysaccharide export system permease protein